MPWSNRQARVRVSRLHGQARVRMTGLDWQRMTGDRRMHGRPDATRGHRVAWRQRDGRPYFRGRWPDAWGRRHGVHDMTTTTGEAVTGMARWDGHAGIE